MVPTLDYEGVIIECDVGMVSGATGIDSDVIDFELDFFDNCNVNGLAATLSCEGTARWHVLSTIAGEIDRLNAGFFCTVDVSSVCTVSFGAQELPILRHPNRADPIDASFRERQE